MNTPRRIARALAGVLCAGGLGVSAVAPAAESAQLLRPAELRSDRFADAAVLATLPAGTAVEWLGTDTGWVRVRAGSVVGWVRASVLGAVGLPAKARAAAVDGGRLASGNLQLAATGIRSLRTEFRHALIVGVGHYARADAVSLEGVAHDVESARAIARAMRVPDANVRVLYDAQASARAISAELDALAGRVRDSEGAFVYFSGLGARVALAEAGEPACAPALLAHDGTVLGPAWLARRLAPVASAAERLLVMYDASASDAGAGAVTTPNSDTATGGLRAKFAPGSACEDAPRTDTSAPAGLAALLGLPASTTLVVGSSRAGEASLDDPRAGGLATRAWRDCALGVAQDSDRSGSVSAAEIGACAQARLDALPGPQHLVWHGEAEIVPIHAP